MLAVSILLALAASPQQPQPPAPLFALGAADGDTRGFALAPDRYREFTRDGCFVVGRSDASLDWPYAQPGPVDSWAGGRRHTFTIAFGLAAAPADQGDCTLRLDFADTHGSQPPHLRILLNDTERTLRLRAGGGDESIYGDAAKGKHRREDVRFPGTALRSGTNVLQVTTTQGSWLLWDHLAFSAPNGTALADVAGDVIAAVRCTPVLDRRGAELLQTVRVSTLHFGPPTKAQLQLGDAAPVDVDLQPGAQELAVPVPAATAPRTLAVELRAGGGVLAQATCDLPAAREMTIYLLPHSHTDIGYTESQARIEQKQVDNLLAGIAAAKRTASYPEGARFVWNVEVLWAADLFLQRLPAAQCSALFTAVQKGQVALQGMYLNELSGLCRPEESLRLYRRATQLGELTGVPIDSAMISDVPGHSWGTVAAMAEAGIRYLSTAPNYIDRIGGTLVQWQDKPFWWLSPSGEQRVLVWIPYRGYALSHGLPALTPGFVDDYLAYLDGIGYPYDIACLRWSGHGDNAVPEPQICDFVRDWNGAHASPRFVIASAHDAFAALEAKHGKQLPEVRGEWSPYWEDGAGSSAKETAMNRATADRLTQAETLFALAGRPLPAADFDTAWQRTLLYSEHTWGAWCSIGQPMSQETEQQWQQKQGYAVEADMQSRALLLRGITANRPAVDAGGTPGQLDVFNTTSWSRSEVVLVPRVLSEAGDAVSDGNGKAVPSQRLASGELAILVEDLPPFARRRLLVARGAAATPARPVAVQDGTLRNGQLTVRIDPMTGGVVALQKEGVDANLVAPGQALNDYLYVLGSDVAAAQRSGAVKLRVLDRGPLVATLRAEGEAPGCFSLLRDYRLCAGDDHLAITNLVDKQRLAAADYNKKESKEAVHFAFPFAVPEPSLRLDLPLGNADPCTELLAGSCRNWLSTGRYVDVANDRFGVSWVTLDAPLVEVGEMSANLLGSQTDPAAWRQTIEPSAGLYSWAMNNHWHTNYRAFQEGPVTFRYVLAPHGVRDLAAASRLAIGVSQPLVVAIGSGAVVAEQSLLQLGSDEVVALCLRPSDDGRALIAVLYGASGREVDVALSWPGFGEHAPRVFLSGTGERRGAAVAGKVRVPGFEVVTLRAEVGE